MAGLDLLPLASSWSLGEDAKLLECLQSLSSTLIAGTRQLHDRMDRLAIEAASASTRLLVTHNNFRQLSNVKFIEARVYDDSEEVREAVGKEGEVQEETHEQVTTEALSCGTKLLQSAFDKVEIEDSDSEDDAPKMISVMQPKNPFHVRSLPAVIGSQAWMEDDKIGLVEEEAEEADESEEESSDEEPEAQTAAKDASDFSQSDVEDASTKPKVEAPMIVKKPVSDLSDFSDDDDELFRPKPTISASVPAQIDGDEEPVENVTEEAPKDFSRDLAKRLRKPESASKASLATHTEESSDEEAEKEAEKPVKAKTLTKVAPVKKSVLFDSSDSDDDLFSGKPPQKAKASATQESKKLPPLPPPTAKPAPPATVIESNTDIQANTPSPLITTLPKKQPPVKKPLFGSSSDDEDDIFADIKVKQTFAPSQKKETTAFDSEDSEDDIFTEKGKHVPPVTDNTESMEETITAPKKPFGGVSMFGGGFKPVASDNVSDEGSEDDDIFNSPVKKSLPPLPPPAAAKPLASGKEENAHEEDSKDDIDVGEAAAITTRDSEVKEKTKTVEKKPFGGVSMFGSGVKPSLTANASDDESEEDDIFKSPMKSHPPPPPPASIKPVTFEKVVPAPLQDSEDDSDGLFSDVTITKKTPTSTSLPPLTDASLSQTAPVASTTATPSEQIIEVDSTQQEEISTPKSRKPFGGVSMLGIGLGMVKESKGDLPVPAPPGQGPLPDEDSLDSLVASGGKVLESATKSRPKGRPGRRAPSRAARKLAVKESQAEEKEDVDEEPEIEKNRTSNPSLHAAAESKENIEDQGDGAIEEAASPKKPFGGMAMFGKGFNPRDVLKTKPNGTEKTIPKLDIIHKDESVPEGGEIADEDILDQSTSETNAQKSLLVNDDADDDAAETSDKLSGPMDAGSDAIQGTNTVSSEFIDAALSVPSSDSIQEGSPNESDDTFSIPIEPKKKELVAASSHKTDWLDDDDDDMFAPPPMPEEKIGATKKALDMFGFDDSEDDDDNLFSNMATGVKPSFKPLNPMADILGDDDSDDDDLFASMISKSDK